MDPKPEALSPTAQYGQGRWENGMQHGSGKYVDLRNSAKMIKGLRGSSIESRIG